MSRVHWERRGGRNWLEIVSILLVGWLMLSGATCDRNRATAVRKLNKALKQYEAGDKQAAILLLESAAEADGDFAKPHYQLGQIHEFDLNELEEAERFYRNALDRASTNEKYAYALARVLGDQGKHQKAIRQLQKVVDRDESQAKAWFRLGISQEAMGRHIKAIQSYMTSIRTNPRMRIGDEDRGGAAYHALGDLYIRFGFYDKARQVYEDGIAHNSKAARLYRGRGVAQLRLERYSEAAESFEQALKRDRDASTAYFNLAVARRGMGRPEAAVRALEKFLNLANRGESRARVAAAQGMIQDLQNRNEETN